MKVSVVTPNYNGERFLKKFLGSLEEDNDYIGEVIIIDNGSDDASLEYLKNNSFNFPLVLIENKENVGFSPAVNQGIRKAQNELIFSINNDTEVKKGSIKALVDLITSDDDIFSVIRDLSQRLQQHRVSRPDYPESLFRHVFEILSSRNSTAAGIKHCITTLAADRSHTFDMIRMLVGDENCIHFLRLDIQMLQSTHYALRSQSCIEENNTASCHYYV